VLTVQYYNAFTSNRSANRTIDLLRVACTWETRASLRNFLFELVPSGLWKMSTPPGLENGSSATTSGKFSLENILGENHDIVEVPEPRSSTPTGGWDQEDASKTVAQGYCIECEGTL